MRKRGRVQHWIDIVSAALCTVIAASPGMTTQAQGQTSAFAPSQSQTQAPPRKPATEPTPTQTQGPPGTPAIPIFEGPNLRIGVTAVEIDAVVTGKGGRPITDLRPEEFQVLQDGRRQAVISARYIPLDPPRGNEATTPVRASAAGGPPPSRMPRPEDVRHTMAIIVDDLNLSFQSMAQIRVALRKFIERDVQSGDLITLVRSGPGVGRFRPFTSDKRVLLEAVERLRYNPFLSTGYGESGGEGSLTSLAAFQRDVFTAGALGAANYVIRGMRDMPGRKSVLIINDGWSPFHTPRGVSSGDPFGNDRLPAREFPTSQPRVIEAMQRLVDETNRSFVVVYTLDARGLIAPSLHLDESGTPPASAFGGASQVVQESQTGPRMLADMAGGLFFGNNNDLAGAMTRVMDDQRGYYLIGYQPDDETFKKDGDRARFHKVRVRVTRRDAKIRARSGFFGVTDEELAPAAPRTRADRLVAAMNRPFAVTDVGVQATSLFWHNPAQGPSVRALVRVDTRTLTFTSDGQGKLRAPVEIGAALIDDRGAISASQVMQFTMTTTDPAPPGLLDAGVVYTVDLPVAAPGPYQLRTAVGDVNADRIGTASEFVIVPRTDGKEFAMSGVLLKGAEIAAIEDDAPTQATESRRRFTPGMEISYAFQVYNARRDEATSRPVLSSRFRLFRDGELITGGALEPITDAPAPAPTNLTLANGSLKLSDDIRPGSYDLEVAVEDTLSKKARLAVQWTNFTVSAR